MHAKNETTQDFHVAPDGSDAWSGRLCEPKADRTDGPLATPARARDVIRMLKVSDGLPPGGITVTVRGGDYPLAEPLVLTAEDSGTASAPIVYRAAEGEAVRLSGGVRISGWRRVGDAATLAPSAGRRPT